MEEYNPVKEAVFAAYDFLYKKGYFISPTDEIARVENLLIQVRIKTNEDDSKKKVKDSELLHALKISREYIQFIKNMKAIGEVDNDLKLLDTAIQSLS